MTPSEVPAHEERVEAYGHGHFEFAAPGDMQWRTFILRFHDPDCREMYFKDEADAWEAWNRYAPSYNVHLFETAPLSRPQQAVSRDEWQPIETAPKTGGRDSPFLARRKGSSLAPDGYWSLCYWSDRCSDWVDYWDGEPSSLHPPTHWMPLPSPPSTTSGGEVGA